MVERDDNIKKIIDEMMKSYGRQLIEPKRAEPERPTELFFEGNHFKIGDLVRTIPCWYVEEEIKQGMIIGFSYFYYDNQYVPAVEIEFNDGTLDKTHPSNIEKIDESWLEMC